MCWQVGTVKSTTGCPRKNVPMLELVETLEHIFWDTLYVSTGQLSWDDVATIISRSINTGGRKYLTQLHKYYLLVLMFCASLIPRFYLCYNVIEWRKKTCSRVLIDHCSTVWIRNSWRIQVLETTQKVLFTNVKAFKLLS